MPLTEFANAGLNVEVESDILGRRIWFVSGAAEVKVLLSRGVARGDIWTAKELLSLTTSGVSGEHLKLIAGAKLLFEGKVSEHGLDPLGASDGER